MKPKLGDDAEAGDLLLGGIGAVRAQSAGSLILAGSVSPAQRRRKPLTRGRVGIAPGGGGGGGGGGGRGPRTQPV